MLIVSCPNDVVLKLITASTWDIDHYFVYLCDTKWGSGYITE